MQSSSSSSSPSSSSSSSASLQNKNKSSGSSRKFAVVQMKKRFYIPSIFTSSWSIWNLMMMMSLCLVLVFPSSVLSFPDGAPGGETCVKHRPNHGAKSQPLSTLPYIVQASASEYTNGSTIAVGISGKSGVYFKGFFVQAVDDAGRWIGQFEENPFSVSHPECSMITHHDNEEKEQVTLIWNPPKNSNQGKVRFMTSVLKNYKIFWVDAVAQVPGKSSSSSS